MTPCGELPKRRLLEELRAISTQYPDMVMCSTEAEPPTFEGMIEIEGHQHRVRLTLPASYPRVPPQLRELDFETGEEVAGWGRPHWLPGLGLCLFPHGNDEQAWRQDRLAVEALDRFRDFIKAESQRRAVGVAVSAARVHIPQDAVDRLSDANVGVIIVHHAMHGGDLYVTHVQLSEGQIDCCFDGFDSWRPFLPVMAAIPWALVKSDSSWKRIISAPECLGEILQEEFSEPEFEKVRTAQQIVLGKVAGPGIEILCFQRPLFALGTPGLLQIPITVGTPSEALFHRVDGALNHRDRLSTETVFFIGLGSLGGAVAVALARAGIRQFVLIDPDSLTVENVCRHVGTLQELGHLKVEVVGENILKVSPEAHVEYIAKPLAWDLPWIGAGEVFEQRLAQTPNALIMSTCAEHRVEHQLNDVAVRAGIPVIYASALGAAEHARIFRVLPSQTPCYACILAAQDADPTRYPRFAIDGIDAEHRPAYSAPGLPGLGIDLTEIAMLTARFALQTIAKLRGFDLGLAPEDGDHLLWTSRGGWVFDRPLQLTVEHFPRSPSCPVCGQSVEHGELDEIGIAELEALTAKLQQR